MFCFCSREFLNQSWAGQGKGRIVLEDNGSFSCWRYLGYHIFCRLLIHDWMAFKKTSHIRNSPFTSLGVSSAVGGTRSCFWLVVNGGRSHLWCTCGLTAAAPATHSSLLFGCLVKGMQRTLKRPHGKDSIATIKGARNPWSPCVRGNTKQPGRLLRKTSA